MQSVAWREGTLRGKGDSKVTILWTEGKPFRYNLKVPQDKMVLYNRELLGGVVYSKANGSIREDGTMRVPVTGVPLLVSTDVSAEQEEATKRYLSAKHWNEWKPIRGAED